MPPTAKIRRALKSAAKLPARVSIAGGRGSGRNQFAPASGELPVVIFRVQVLACKDLLAKDRNGSSDPFVVVSLLNSRHQTPVSKRTVNPSYAPKDATFEFPLYLSLADKLGVVEFVVWDKDMLSKDYLGEAAFPLEDWFTDKEGNPRPYAFNHPQNMPFSLNIVSTRANTNATGTIQVKIGFVTPPTAAAQIDFADVYSELNKRSRPSLVSAPPTEGVGTVRSHQGGPEFEDDGGLSSDESSDDDDFPDASTPFTSTFMDSPSTSPLLDLYIPQKSPSEMKGKSPSANVTEAELSPETPTPSGVKTPTPRSSSGFIPRMKFPRKISNLTASSLIQVPTSPSTPLTPGEQSQDQARVQTTEKKARFRKSWVSGSGSGTASSGGSGSDSHPTKRGGGYRLDGANDIVGIVMLEIQGAEDLPRLKNMTRTGWDMDPFIVISFGKKVFRTRVIRHSRSPVWDEKLLFHVRRYETNYKVQLTILDWDKLSSNDHIGDASFNVAELLQSAPQPDLTTGLYPSNADGEHAMKDFSLPLSTAKEMPWEAKHNPILKFRAKYQPYDALRQRFWRQYLKQYDTDDTKTLSHLELTSMLDSLGSTLTRSTLASFFTRHGKIAHKDDLTFDEVIQCLETELGRPDEEKNTVDTDESLPDSASVTPILQVSDQTGKELALDRLDFSGPSLLPRREDSNNSSLKPSMPSPYETEPMQQPLQQVVVGDERPGFDSSSDDAEEDVLASQNPQVPDPVAATTPVSASSTKKMRFKNVTGRVGGKKKIKAKTEDSEDRIDSVERVINVKNCPLCHRPRMSSKAEVDIVTHLAVCASQDWNKVDRIVVGNFVTASQAQRKWYTRILSKVSSGDYRLGANSANIIVQNRMTGQLEEEKMQVYVRLGIRLLYKGMNSRMEGGRARRLLKSLSIKQGVKYDSPESARDIPAFIEFHGLPVSEILDPIDSFQTFNQFFYRKLKPSARPVERLTDPYRLVSVADCRLMTFKSVNEATKIWIKGREFTVTRLLGDAYKHQADRYNEGALAIFRLAPQDYHRFHSPVDGTIGPMTYISGEYYTVNPQAIRTALDVYGENVRKIVPIDSPQFGRVMAVCVGAMMVGSIETTVQEGQKVERGQEFGYFAFGGSTIVLLFEKGVVEWDEDLLNNGRASLETLVRVGMGIGLGRRVG